MGDLYSKITARLVELLTTDEVNARISAGDKWLVGNKCAEGLEFIVYQKKYKSKRLIVLYDGNELLKAMNYLFEE